LEITELTRHRWKNQYDGMKTSDAKWLNELEGEKSRLKRFVADRTHDIDMLKLIAERNLLTRHSLRESRSPSRGSSRDLEMHGPSAATA
jgi:hypothetical protein